MGITRLLPILWARRRIALLVFGATMVTTLLASLLLPKTYVAESVLVIDSRPTDPLTGAALPAYQLVDYLATQVDVISSHSVALKAVDELKLADDPSSREAFLEKTDGAGSMRDWLAERLVKGLEVTPSRNSAVIRIGFASRNAEFAASAANAFAQGFIATNLEIKTEPVKRQSQWFDTQVSGLRKSLEEAQLRLADYQRGQNIVGGNDRLDVENARLSELSSQLITAQSDLFDAQSRLKLVTQAIAQGRTLELPDILGNTPLQTMKAELARAKAKFAETTQRYDRNHPQYQSAAAEVAALETSFAAEISNATGSIKQAGQIAAQRVTDRQAALDTQVQRVLKLKSPQNEYDVLQRDVEIAQRSYDSALQRASDVRLASQLDQSGIAVLNSAVPPRLPARPVVALNMVLAIFFGGLLAFATAFVVEMFDRRVRTTTDLSEAAGVLVLAEVPRLFRTHEPSTL